MVDQHGWHGDVHLLRFEEATQCVKDGNGHTLFQNRYGVPEFNALYISELNKCNVPQWFYVKDFLKQNPLTVYHWDDKIRLGIQQDGGYVIANNIGPYDMYISAGVSCEESFTRDFVNMYHMNESNSFAFDGTIESYPYEYTTNISFIRKNISTVNDTRNTNLDNLLASHTNAFLKMDIEGHEWKWIHYTNHLKNIKQMVIEFHGVYDECWCGNKNNLPPGFTYECFEKIAETHYLIHVHGNTVGGSVDGLPNVIELTYVRKDNHVLRRNTTCFPIKGLDFPNGQNDSEFILKNKPYVNA